MKKQNYIDKYFFKSSLPEPLGQFQLNLVQNILGWWEFKFVSKKDQELFQGGEFTK